MEAGGQAYADGKVPEAEVKFLAALAEAESFGENDPRLALCLNNLAGAYLAQGKYTMAEPVYKRCLDIRLSVCDGPHSDVALTHHNLAVLYSARRMYPLAEKHYKAALEMKESLYGADSSELLITLGYYAQFMKVQNRLVDKQLIESRIKEITEKRLNASVS